MRKRFTTGVALLWHAARLINHAFWAEIQMMREERARARRLRRAHPEGTRGGGR